MNISSDLNVTSLGEVELVKDYLGSTAVEHAISINKIMDGVVTIVFPEGVLYASVDVSIQSVEVFLLKWAQDLGWEFV